jgi:diphthamide biosynthesis protein 2
MLLPNATVYIHELPVPVETTTGVAAVADAGPMPTPQASAPSGGLTLRRLDLQTSKRLMRRYFLMLKAREAEVVGILIGTLSASGRKQMLAALKRLVRLSGRKYYVFVMGKLNSAKLANFLEVGVYVLLGSCEHSILDSKEFYRPVVTPYELHLALSPGAEWTGEYILDYGRLLPRLRSEDDGADTPEGDTKGASDDNEPQFSLLSGRLISHGATTADDVDDEGDGALTESGGGIVARQGEYALARSGAEFLARRGYRGLEPRLGEHAPARVVEGLSGVASSFEGEGEARAPAAAALLE